MKPPCGSEILPIRAATDLWWLDSRNVIQNGGVYYVWGLGPGTGNNSETSQGQKPFGGRFVMLISGTADDRPDPGEFSINPNTNPVQLDPRFRVKGVIHNDKGLDCIIPF